MDNLLRWNYHVKIKDDDLAVYVFVNVYLVHVISQYHLITIGGPLYQNKIIRYFVKTYHSRSNPHIIHILKSSHLVDPHHNMNLWDAVAQSHIFIDFWDVLQISDVGIVNCPIFTNNWLHWTVTYRQDTKRSSQTFARGCRWRSKSGHQYNWRIVAFCIQVKSILEGTQLDD